MKGGGQHQARPKPEAAVTLRRRVITPELPAELYAALADRAHAESREKNTRVSMNSLVIAALERFLYDGASS